MVPKTCLDILTQKRTMPSEAAVCNHSGKASRRGPYSLHGIDWVNNELKLFAIFDKTRMNVGEYDQLTQQLPENTYVSRKRFIIEGLDKEMRGDIPPLLQLQSGVQEIEVQWSPWWFKIQDLDKEPVAALLNNELLRSRLAKIPRAHSRLYWRNDVGVVFLDDEAPSHLCLRENCEVCKDL